jgi:hypothetical protein
MALKYAKMKDASEWADMTMKFMPCKHPRSNRAGSLHRHGTAR